MPKPFKTWTVLPHSKLSSIDEDLLTVVGDLPMPIGSFPRRMTVVRLKDGRLVIYSAIALHEEEMRELEAFGEPEYLVVPNELHRMDAKSWKARYPHMMVVAPGGARDKVSEVVPVDCSTVDFDDSRVRLETIAGTGECEIALFVKTITGTTLIVNDLIWNVGDRPGLGGWLYKAIGATGNEPKIPKVVKMRRSRTRRGCAHSWSLGRASTTSIASSCLTGGS
jgi:hypothetical protein